jgi:xanthine dehydrogenase large subunit
MSELSDRPENPSVGDAIPHESASLHVTGAALYTDDLVYRTKHVLHAYPVQVPQAHALVTALRTEPALAVSGVVRVLTAADVPGVNDAGVKHDEPLFPTEIMFHGHAVCWVLAETIEAARLGAAAVEVDVEPLPALVTVREAIDAHSFQGAQPQLVSGDIEAGFARSTHVFSGEFEFSGQEHFYLETHAALAHVDEGEQIFVQSSTQHPSETQEIVAHVLGRHSHEVTVQCLRMGGAFGGKEMQPHGFAAIAALGAVLTGRPVRLRLTRTQDLTMSGKRHGFHSQWRVGFDGEGRLQALDATLTADGGWSLDLSEPVLARALCHIDNAYWIPDIRVNGRIAKTNKTSNTAFRGFGGPQGMLVIEDILGRCAPLLGEPFASDPAELRRRNFYTAGQSTPYAQPVRHPERMTAIWDELHECGRVRDRQVDIEKFNATHEHVKRALALTPVKFGISFNLTAFNQAGALVHVYKDGSVLINHGGTEMGQGLHTKMLQIAATTLGIPLGRVRLAPTRTDKVPNTSATAASSGADLNGGAVKNACEQILARLHQVAGLQLGTNPSDIRIVDGVARALGGERTVQWKDLVLTAYMERVQLSAAGYYRTEGLHWDSRTFRGSPFKYFAYGAAATEVEVDGFTGAYRTRRVDIVHDVGDSLSPLVDLGQIEGGFVQGAGWLTLEDLRWDIRDGRLLTQAASTYKLPSFSEMPDTFNVTLLQNATEEGAVYGSKAVGEPPLMLAFSVREALRQAAAAFGPAGTSVDLASPATPEAVYWALEQAREHRAHGHIVEGGNGSVPPQPGADAHPMRPLSEQVLEAVSHA